MSKTITIFISIFSIALLTSCSPNERIVEKFFTRVNNGQYAKALKYIAPYDRVEYEKFCAAHCTEHNRPQFNIVSLESESEDLVRASVKVDAKDNDFLRHTYYLRIGIVQEGKHNYMRFNMNEFKHNPIAYGVIKKDKIPVKYSPNNSSETLYTLDLNDKVLIDCRYGNANNGYEEKIVSIGKECDYLNDKVDSLLAHQADEAELGYYQQKLANAYSLYCQQKSESHPVRVKNVNGWYKVVYVDGNDFKEGYVKSSYVNLDVKEGVNTEFLNLNWYQGLGIIALLLIAIVVIVIAFAGSIIPFNSGEPTVIFLAIPCVIGVVMVGAQVIEELIFEMFIYSIF